MDEANAWLRMRSVLERMDIVDYPGLAREPFKREKQALMALAGVCSILENFQCFLVRVHAGLFGSWDAWRECGFASEEEARSECPYGLDADATTAVESHGWIFTAAGAHDAVAHDALLYAVSCFVKLIVAEVLETEGEKESNQ